MRLRAGLPTIVMVEFPVMIMVTLVALNVHCRPNAQMLRW